MPHVERLLQETYPTMWTGSSGGRTGCLMLPGGFLIEGESKAGDRVQVALKVVTPDGEYGAVLTFTLQKSRNGFKPADVSVDVLRTLLAPTPSARLTGAKATYTDPAIGYSIDYPKGWHVQAQASGVTVLTSLPVSELGKGGVGANQAKVDVAPMKPSECGSLQELVNVVRGEDGKPFGNKSGCSQLRFRRSGSDAVASSATWQSC